MAENKNQQLLKKAFDPDIFKKQGYRVIDILSEYLKDLQQGKIKTVLPNLQPEEMLSNWTGDFPSEPNMEWEGTVQKLIELSNHLHHPKYIGHQCTSPVPFAALMESIGALLNNGTAVYEMGPVNVAMEKRVIQWMANLIGYSKQADGIFTSGGTLGNLTALLAARQAKSDYDIWKKGVSEKMDLKVIVSQQSHYSVKRAVSIMGLGEDSVITIPVDNNYKMDPERVAAEYQSAVAKGSKILALVANACSTATGSYDNIAELGRFCNKESIWLHVDAAHGASALLSAKYKYLLSGIEVADSVVWDAHKMLLMPALTTAVIFKDGSSSYEAFSQKASYLFESDSRDEWYNFAHRTMECTKRMMGMKLYMSLSVLGTGYFSRYLDYMYDLTKSFAGILTQAPDFQLAVKPESNIICFRYLNNENSGKQRLNDLQKTIRKNILKSEQFYIVQTELKGEIYLRCTIINPLTTIHDLKELLQKIRAMDC